MQQLRTIHLPPALSKLCNGETVVELAAANFAQIVSGLVARYGIEVRKFIAPNWWHIRFDDNEDFVDQEDIHDLGQVQNIYISPAVEGAGRAGQIILGVVMIVVGVIITVTSWGSGTAQGAMAVMQGITMIAGGAMQIYTALNTPKAAQQRAEVDERASFVYNGAVNIVEQGTAVPLWYGLFEGGSVVASAGIYTEQLAVYNTAPGGNWAPDDKFGVHTLPL